VSPKGSDKYADGARPAVEAGIPVKIVDNLIELLGAEEAEITRDTRIREDLGADSLDVVELVMACEEEYGITIDDATGAAIESGTVGDLVDVLAKRGVRF
jgi:acyl carrier protein